MPSNCCRSCCLVNRVSRKNKAFDAPFGSRWPGGLTKVALLYSGGFKNYNAVKDSLMKTSSFNEPCHCEQLWCHPARTIRQVGLCL